jgi:hypothetical protein
VANNCHIFWCPHFISLDGISREIILRLVGHCQAIISTLAAGNSKGCRMENLISVLQSQAVRDKLASPLTLLAPHEIALMHCALFSTFIIY